MKTLSIYAGKKVLPDSGAEGKHGASKLPRSLAAGAFCLGVLAISTGAQATEAPSIEKSCLFFNKVVFHLTTDLVTNSGAKLLANDVREIIIQARLKTPANNPTNVTTALFSALCSDINNCIHNRDNTKIDSVELSADCDDEAIRRLTASKSP